MASKSKTIMTRNVNKGAGGKRIDQQKYEIIRKAVLASVPRGKTGILFKDLPKAVAARVPAELFTRKGSISWYATTVKLDLEARGLIERIPGESPQRLRRTAGTR